MKKITQEQVAEAIGISRTHLSEIFSGNRRPSWDVAKRIGEYFGEDPALFMEHNVDLMCEIYLKHQIDHNQGGDLERQEKRTKTA